MNQFKFTVIIPVFNAEKHLKKCIESILKQTFQYIEIITIDDGSTDQSLSILNELAILDTRIMVLSQINAGPSVARNKGLVHASGDYISFIDADDWLEENAFQILYNNIIENKYPDLVMFNNFVNDSKKNKPFLKSGLYDKIGIINSIYPRLLESTKESESAIRASVCLRIFKNNVLNNQIKFKSELKNNEDLVFTFEATLKAITFLYLGDLYIYHNNMTVGSISRGYLHNSFEKMKPLFNILTNIASQQNEFDFHNQIKSRVFRTLIFCVENEFRKDNPKSFLNKYIYIRALINKHEFKKHLSDFVPIKEKSKLLYYWFYKAKFVIGLVVLAKYRVNRQEKSIQYV